MVDYILAGLSAGLCAFVAFFIISFVTLSLLAGIVHLVGRWDRSPFLAKRPAIGREPVA